MNITEFENIAILQTAFIGDIALTFPLAQAIKNGNPNCKLTFITTPQAYELVKTCECVDEVITFDKRGAHRSLTGLINFGKSLSDLNFDLILSPHKSVRSSIICYLQKRSLKIGFDISSIRCIYDYKVRYIKSSHEVVRNLELLSPFKIKAFTKLKDVKQKFSQKDIENVDSIVGNNDRFIVIAAGSVWNTKKWIPEYFADLAKRLIYSGYKVYLSGSAADKEVSEQIAASSGAINLTGTTNLPQTLLLIMKSKLLITNDSAPTHFAGLVNTPVITIFGPTSPIFGFSPLSDKSLSLHNESLNCSPCRIHGSNKCPIDTHQCMKSILPDNVFSEAIKMLNS